jgi:hypothetical protein
LFRARSRVERGAFAPADVSIQRELRNQQDLSACFDDRAVHFPVGIFEDTQSRNLIGDVAAIGFTVGGRNAKQDQQSRTDARNALFLYGHRGPVDPLHYRSHAAQGTPKSHARVALPLAIRVSAGFI